MLVSTLVDVSKFFYPNLDRKKIETNLEIKENN